MRPPAPSQARARAGAEELLLLWFVDSNQVPASSEGDVWRHAAVVHAVDVGIDDVGPDHRRCRCLKRRQGLFLPLVVVLAPAFFVFVSVVVVSFILQQ